MQHNDIMKSEKHNTFSSRHSLEWKHFLSEAESFPVRRGTEHHRRREVGMDGI